MQSYYDTSLAPQMLLQQQMTLAPKNFFDADIVLQNLAGEQFDASELQLEILDEFDDEEEEEVEVLVGSLPNSYFSSASYLK